MDTLEAIRSRRSVRRFSDRPVETDEVLKLLELAGRAPSGGNLQPWHFIVVHRPQTIRSMADLIREKIDELRRTPEAHADDPSAATAMARRFESFSLFFEQAPVTLAVLVRYEAHTRGQVERLVRLGMDRFEAHRTLGFVEVQSVAAAIQNLLLAAHARGFGACWMNVPSIAKEALMVRLRVRPPWDLLALVPIGHPDPSYSPARRTRKKLETIVSFA